LYFFNTGGFGKKMDNGGQSDQLTIEDEDKDANEDEMIIDDETVEDDAADYGYDDYEDE